MGSRNSFVTLPVTGSSAHSPAEDDVHNGAHLIAVDRGTVTLRWTTQVDKHPAAVITGSPVVSGNVVYVGVSSIEEALAENPGYTCCTFRGNVVALNATTGEMMWKTYDMPDNGGQPGGYSGGAIWQPPAIDPTRGLLYVGTGNNYDAPEAVKACQAAALAANNLKADCSARDDYFDAALALDLATGKIKWSKRLQGYDVWTVPCIRPRAGVSCTSPNGPDYNLGGSGPNLLPHIVGFGQKSGMFIYRADVRAGYNDGQCVVEFREPRFGDRRPFNCGWSCVLGIGLRAHRTWNWEQ